MAEFVFMNANVRGNRTRNCHRDRLCIKVVILINTYITLFAILVMYMSLAPTIILFDSLKIQKNRLLQLYYLCLLLVKWPKILIFSHWTNTLTDSCRMCLFAIDSLDNCDFVKFIIWAIIVLIKSNLALKVILINSVRPSEQAWLSTSPKYWI